MMQQAHETSPGVHGSGELATVGEVCRYLRCCRRTLMRWVSAGRIRAVRTPGGGVRFRWSDVSEALTVASRRR